MPSTLGSPSLSTSPLKSLSIFSSDLVMFSRCCIQTCTDRQKINIYIYIFFKTTYHFNLQAIHMNTWKFVELQRDACYHCHWGKFRSLSDTFLTLLQRGLMSYRCNSSSPFVKLLKSVRKVSRKTLKFSLVATVACVSL